VLRSAGGVDVADEAQLRLQLPFLAELTSYLNDTGARQAGTRRYMKDRRLRGAYLLYYTTANMLKPWRALRELRYAGQLPSSVPLRVLDLGAGPGTGVAGLAALLPDAGAAGTPQALHITAVDNVQANGAMYAEVARAMARETGRDIHIESVTADAAKQPRIEGEFDLVLAMNLLNEIPASRRAALLQWCGEHLSDSGHLLLIEPALRETSRALLMLRDAAVESGWTVFSPCLRQSDCPALEKDSDWCHDDVPWQRPAFMEILDEGMGNIKKSLKYSYMLLNRHGATLRDALGASPTHGTLQRVVSERFDEKGRVWWHMCGEGGRVVCQRNHRDRADGNADADRLMRYDILTLRNEEERAHDIRLPREGIVRIVDSTNTFEKQG
jgi:ribosomal protein RSM22 (predicted rRNA methylase)